MKISNASYMRSTSRRSTTILKPNFLKCFYCSCNYEVDVKSLVRLHVKHKLRPKSAS